MVTNHKGEKMSKLHNAIICISIFILYSLICVAVFPSEIQYSNDAIANAIYKAEGSEKAKKPYGILSVPCEGEKDCRKICLNTIRNQRIRHAKHDCGFTYLECLSRRYAPISAKNDPLMLNQFWLGNVTYFLENAK